MSENSTTMTSVPANKTVGDPIAKYESLKPIWERARAVINGQNHAKAYDRLVDTIHYRNLLIPFSPRMEQMQYDFYRAEAELPGLVGQYCKVLVGGLLRKPPQFNIPKGVDEEAEGWLKTNFGADGNSMISVLDEALWEEMQTSRAWIMVDFPQINPDDYDAMTPEQRKEFSPYASVIKADHVINWQKGKTKKNVNALTRLIVRGYVEEFTDASPFHPTMVDIAIDYHLDSTGNYAIQKYRRDAAGDQIEVVNGQIQNKMQQNTNAKWIPDGPIVTPMMHGERIPYIPIWPLNGNLDAYEPVLQPLIDREIGLYNKISRRNHLLYGASTYTPVISADLNDEDFEEIVNGGLGTWIRLPATGKADVLKTPTEALKDMEASIAATIEEMARMGIRMLSPEGSSAESGTALEIRNAAQTAQLGLLNTKVSKTLESVLKTMLEWKYDVEVKEEDIDFQLSQDFNPTPLGDAWMRLITEWYQGGIIPRSVFLQIAKQNDIIPVDYDDKEGQKEIQDDPLVNTAPTKIDSSLMDGVPGADSGKPGNGGVSGDSSGLKKKVTKTTTEEQFHAPAKP
jgi:hypothetical protein